MLNALFRKCIPITFPIMRDLILHIVLELNYEMIFLEKINLHFDGISLKKIANHPFLIFHILFFKRKFLE